MDSKDSSGNSSQPMLKAEQETVHHSFIPLNRFQKRIDFGIILGCLGDLLIGKSEQQY